ncbi:DUF2637 domain-containing protein [Nocardia fluminea]|uniref:Uncharacterized protein DUF2637 n=1 Tax=Nocardia fluminea TaxID=134984 RepID=A0A2N3V6T2_9NOCA|nr:DUF2637 domain-containing protein [Nocardia fluminea]PKV77310.1 uncharacterized protein DUF2637 [Nocardia fluminea]
MDTADQQSSGMRWARWSAVLVLIGIGAAAFVLSFAALQDLAIMGGTPPGLAWLFPVIVDGTIIQATMAVIALPPKSAEHKWFSWILVGGAAVSVSSNSVHAYLTGHSWGGALLAAIPPLALLIDTHGLVLLRRAAQRDSAPAVVETAPVTTADTDAPNLAPMVTASTPAPASAPVQTFHSPPRPVAPLLPVAVPIPTGGN